MLIDDNSGNSGQYAARLAISSTLLTSPVPLSAAAWLFGSGLAAMAGFARRRSNGQR